MPEWLQWSLIIAGLVAITLLLVFIRRQIGLLSENRKRQAKAEEFQTNRRKYMIRSIRVIAMAVEEDQIEYSEACLRLKGLLDHIAPELLDQAPFRIFQEVHDQLQHRNTPTISAERLRPFDTIPFRSEAIDPPQHYWSDLIL